MQIDLREALRIEKRAKRHKGTRFDYWVLDVRGANTVEAGPFATLGLAQGEWRRQADKILLEWTR